MAPRALMAVFFVLACCSASALASAEQPVSHPQQPPRPTPGQAEAALPFALPYFARSKPGARRTATGRPGKHHASWHSHLHGDRVLQQTEASVAAHTPDAVAVTRVCVRFTGDTAATATSQQPSPPASRRLDIGHSADAATTSPRTHRDSLPRHFQWLHHERAGDGDDASVHWQAAHEVRERVLTELHRRHLASSSNEVAPALSTPSGSSFRMKVVHRFAVHEHQRVRGRRATPLRGACVHVAEHTECGGVVDNCDTVHRHHHRLQQVNRSECWRLR